MRTVISLTFGILLAYVVGSLLGTQVVLSNVASMGLDVTLAMRVSSSLSDLSGPVSYTHLTLPTIYSV